LKAARTGLLVALAVLGLGTAATAQHLTASLGAAGFFPSNAAYREIYGRGLAVAGDLWLSFERHFGLVVGFGRLSDYGLAVAGPGGDGSYPLSFRRTTVPLLAFYQIGTKAVTLRLGAGAGFHSYRESWDTIDLAFKDTKVGTRLTLAFSAAVLGRFSLYTSMTYDTVPTGAGGALASNIDLGGFQVLGGLAVRIF
jgi:hypothetical protein